MYFLRFLASLVFAIGLLGASATLAADPDACDVPSLDIEQRRVCHARAAHESYGRFLKIHPGLPASLSRDERAIRFFQSVGSADLLRAAPPLTSDERRNIELAVQLWLSDSREDALQIPALRDSVETAGAFQHHRLAFRLLGTQGLKPGEKPMCIYEEFNNRDLNVPELIGKKCGDICRFDGSALHCRHVVPLSEAESPSVGESGKALLGCLDPLKKQRAGIRGDQVCGLLEQSGLKEFESEVRGYMAASSVDFYYNLLRIQAVSRLVESHQRLTGKPFQSKLPECASFQGAINRKNQEAPAPRPGEPLYFSNPGSEPAAILAARKIVMYARELKTRRENPQHTDKVDALGRRFSNREAYQLEQARLQELPRLIAAEYGRFPELAHDRPRDLLGSPLSLQHTSQGLEQLAAAKPGDPGVAEFAVAARKKTEEQLASQISRYCKGANDKSGISLQEISSQRELVLATLGEEAGAAHGYNLELREVQACLDKQNSRKAVSAAALDGALAGGCMAATLVGGPLGAALCLGAATSVTASKYDKARDRALNQEDCAAAGGLICSGEERLEGLQALDAAADEVLMSVLSSPLDLAEFTATARLLKATLSAQELKTLAAEFKGVARASKGDEVLSVLELQRRHLRALDPSLVEKLIRKGDFPEALKGSLLGLNSGEQAIGVAEVEKLIAAGMEKGHSRTEVLEAISRRLGAACDIGGGK